MFYLHKDGVFIFCNLHASELLSSMYRLIETKCKFSYSWFRTIFHFTTKKCWKLGLGTKSNILHLIMFYNLCNELCLKPCKSGFFPVLSPSNQFINPTKCIILLAKTNTSSNSLMIPNTPQHKLRNSVDPQTSQNQPKQHSQKATNFYLNTKSKKETKDALLCRCNPKNWKPRCMYM